MDALIGDLYQDRSSHSYSGTKLLDIGGTNAAPNSAACAQVATLRASFGWNILCNGC